MNNEVQEAVVETTTSLTKGQKVGLFATLAAAVCGVATFVVIKVLKARKAKKVVEVSEQPAETETHE